MRGVRPGPVSPELNSLSVDSLRITRMWGLHLTRVTCGGGLPSCQHSLFAARGRVPVLVPDRCGLLGLPGGAAPAGRLCLPGLRLGDGRFMCCGCGSRTSVTAGTIFDRTRTLFKVWSNACWLIATGKVGMSAVSLKRTLDIGSCQTEWTTLHRLRSVLVRPGRDQLTGMVEVDETYIGGQESGLPAGAERTPDSYCPACTGSLRWPSGGCWVPTRAPWTVRTWPATWTSSCSASTAASPAVAGWCSPGCLNSPLFTSRCATRIWSPPSDPVSCHPRRRKQAHTRRVSSALGQTARGETPVKWRARIAGIEILG